MGLQASIDIKYHYEIEFKTLMETLFNHGWTVENYSGIVYTIDDEDFNWKDAELSEKDVIMQLMFEAFSNNKLACIELSLPNLVGCSFHFMPGKRYIMLLVSIQRVKLENSNLTDYSFYIKKLLPILKNCAVITCSDAH